jgi:DNA-binding PadR family transcriptional regulator
VLVEVIRRNATTGTNDAREIRQALRYLHEKGYVKVEWLATGDFESVRITTDGIDYVQGGVDSDSGVLLHGR